MNSVRSLLLSGRSEVRLLSGVPRRSKRHIACSDFLCFARKVRARSFCCSSFPPATRFAGLAGGGRPSGRLFLVYGRNIGLTALARRGKCRIACAVFLCPCPKRRHPSSPSHQHSCDRLLILTRPLFKAGSRISLYRISVRGQYAVPASGRGCWITEDPAPDRKP